MKLIVFLADGFEEVEALTTVDYLRRMDIKVDTVSIGGERMVEGAHGVPVIADKLLADIEGVDSYEGVILPGGLPGATNLRDNARVIEIIREANREEKLLAAICAGPIALEKAGVIEGKKVTSYPGFGDQLGSGIYKEEKVVRDGNIITSRGPALAVDFAIEIIRYVLNEEKAEELKKDILY